VFLCNSIGHRAVTSLGSRCMQQMPPTPTCVSDMDPLMAHVPAAIGDSGPVLTLFASGGALRYCKVLARCTHLPYFYCHRLFIMTRHQASWRLCWALLPSPLGHRYRLHIAQ
jgi:hypothetical protein